MISDIMASWSKALLRSSGAITAWKAGMVDYLHCRDPLETCGESLAAACKNHCFESAFRQITIVVWVIRIWEPLDTVLNRWSNGYEPSGDDDKFNR
jgi:hypothetical protein